MRRVDSRTGTIVVLAMLVVMTITTYTTVRMARTVTDLEASRRFQERVGALHAAEAGVDQAILQLVPGYQGSDANANASPDPGEWQAIASDTSYWIGVTPLGGDLYQLDARGMRGGLIQRLQVAVELGSEGLPPAAVIATGPVSAVGEAGATAFVTIEGSVIANYTGNESISLQDAKVLAGGDVVLAGAPATPTLYLDPGSGSAPTRSASTISGASYPSALALGYIDPVFDVNSGVTLSNPTPAQAQADASTKHVALLGRNGPQETVVQGRVRAQAQPLALPDPTIPSLAPIAGYANNCTMDFTFGGTWNSLTVGAPLVGTDKRLLPAGDYCFRSFKSSGADARLFFVGAPGTRIYVQNDGGVDVNLNTYARVNWTDKPSDAALTRPAEDLWLLVKGTTAINIDHAKFSGSIYAPQSTVTLNAGSGGATAFWGMVVGNAVDLRNQVSIRNFEGGGLPADSGPLTPSKPQIRSWRRIPSS